MTMAGTTPTFAASVWNGTHLVLHVGLPFNQVAPPRGQVAWGATRCGLAVRLNGTHPHAADRCAECWGQPEEGA